MPLVAATVVMFKYDGIEDVFDEVKADSMAQGGRKSKLSGGINEQLEAEGRREQDIFRQSLFATELSSTLGILMIP